LDASAAAVEELVENFEMHLTVRACTMPSTPAGHPELTLRGRR
jgi:hypothetical protein